MTAVALATGGVVTASSASAGPVAGGTVNAGTFTVGGGGTVEDPGPAAPTNTIVTTAPRTILTFSTFDLEAGHELHISVGSNSDIVLIRVPAGTAQVHGELVVTRGVPTHANPADPSSAITNVGGNVWLLAPSGVTLGSTAQVDVGGLLAFTGGIPDSDFTDGDLAFGLSGATGFGTQVFANGAGSTSGAVIRGHGGLVGLVSRQVSTAFGSQVVSAPGSRSEVLLGGVRNASLLLGARPDGHLDLVRFEPSGANRDGGVAAAGALTAADVFVSSTGTTTSPDTASAYTTTVTANGRVADGDGDFVMSAGGGLARPLSSAPMRPLFAAGAPAQHAATMGTMRANRNIVVASSDKLDLSYDTDLGAPSVAVSARGALRNFEGRSAVNATLTQQWVLYAPQPSDVVHFNTEPPFSYGTLDSGRTAVWGGTLDTRPPSSVTGNRYVFSNPPDITVTAEDGAKVFDEAFDARVAADLTATIAGSLHPGIPNLFLGDTGPLHTGAPALRSEGAPHTAPERPGGYPVVPSLGTLASPLGYDFVFVNGTLTVDDRTPPTVTPTVTGTQGANGWYTGDVDLSWAIVDPGTLSGYITGDDGCAGRTITSDQTGAAYTCTGTSLGGVAEPVTVRIDRDATGPVLTITATSDGSAYAAGTWTDADVVIDYTCDGAVSGVASLPDDTTVSSTGDHGGTCTDAAGNSTTVPFQVNIDTVDPVPSGVVARTATGPYAEGSPANGDVTVSWTCTDEGGSELVAAGDSSTLTATGEVVPTCSDTAGNTGTGAPFAVVIDRTSPTIVEPTLTSGGTSYTPGTFTNEPVRLTWGCADAAGTGGAQEATTSGTLTATCTDDAGNVATESFEVLVDATAPRVVDPTLTTADGSAYTSGTWTDQAVTLTWTCTDEEGGSGAVLASGTRTATSTGPLQAVCEDRAGNGAVGELFQADVDTTNPTLGALPANQSVTTTGDVATATWTAPTATDDQDTAVEVVCSPPSGSSFPIGTTTVTCTATDHAGNTDSGTFTVTVARDAPPPTASVTMRAPIDAPPVLNTALHTRTVPVRVSLVRPAGTTAAPLYAGAPEPVACSVTRRSDAVEFYTSRPTRVTNLFVWDPVKRNWLYKLDPRTLGLTKGTCYRVPVMYGGTVQQRMASGGSEVGFLYLRTS